jgi:hypothetical protein
MKEPEVIDRHIAVFLVGKEGLPKTRVVRCRCGNLIPVRHLDNQGYFMEWAGVCDECKGINVIGANIPDIQKEILRKIKSGEIKV